MRDATLERTKEIKALSVFTRIAECYTHLHALTERVIRHTEKVLISAVTIPQISRRLKKRAFDGYVKQPLRLCSEFTELTKSISDSSSHAHSAIYGFMTATFDLQRFRGARSDCARLDELLAQQIARDQTQLLGDLFPEAGTRDRRTKQDMLLEALHALRDQHLEHLDILRRAFRESSPLRKLEEIAFGIGNAKWYVQSTFPPSVELGEDEYLPITLGYFYIANPPNIVTNYVFLHDFCYSQGYDVIFQGWIEQAMSVLKTIVEKRPEFQPAKFFKTKDR
jgi:hypothetical protein